MYAVGDDITLIDEAETKSLTGLSLDCEVNIALAVKSLRALGKKNLIFALGRFGSAVVEANEITFVDAEGGTEVIADKEFADAVKSATENGLNAVAAVSAAQKEIGKKQ